MALKIFLLLKFGAVTKRLLYLAGIKLIELDDM